MYHDHGPSEPLPLYKGLFGPIIIRDPAKPRPDREFFVAFHSFQPAATGLSKPFYCINGRAYAGNTPNLKANVGDDVAFHVYAVDDYFHTFHIHGHRWTPTRSGTIDRQRHARPRRRHDGPLHRGQPGPLVLPLPRVQPPASRG